MNTQTNSIKQIDIKTVGSANIINVRSAVNIANKNIFEKTKNGRKAYFGDISFQLFRCNYEVTFTAVKVGGQYQTNITSIVAGGEVVTGGVDYFLMAIDAVNGALVANDKAIAKKDTQMAVLNAQAEQSLAYQNDRIKNPKNHGNHSWWA